MKNCRVAKTLMMPTRPPMPQVKPPCKHRITLICKQDDTWEIHLGDVPLCNADSYPLMMEKLNTLIEILD